MADKIVLDNVAGTYDVTKINSNFDKIEAEFNNKVLYRDNPASTVNTVKQDLDMNSQRIINLPSPLSPGEPLRRADLNLITGGGTDPFLRSDLSASNGSGLVGFIQSGIGAIAKTVQTKLREWVSANDYTTTQQAITAAGPTGSILIPATHSLTDSYSNPNDIAVLDQRNGSLGVWSWINPSFPVAGYPMGNDLVMRSMGSADTYIEHYHVTATTTTSLIVGWNMNVPISAVKCGNLRTPTFRTGGAELFSTIAQLVIGRETANEEQVDQGSWSYVDSTHINILCTKTHSGTIDIDQGGSTLLNSYDLYIGANVVKPTQNTTYNPPLRVKDLHGNIIVNIPSDLDSAMPYGGWQWGCIQMGKFGANKDMLYQNALSVSQYKWRSSAGATIAALTDTGYFSVVGGIGSGIGQAKSNGSLGEVQFGRLSTVPSTPADAFVVWGDNVNPMNSLATAGALLLYGSGFAGSGVVLGGENTPNIALTKNRIGFYGTPAVTKPSVPGVATDPATTMALANALRAALIALGLVA